MKEFLIYLLVTGACTGLLYGCYLMRRESSFALNRALLLTIVLLPLAIPFVPLPAAFGVREVATVPGSVPDERQDAATTVSGKGMAMMQPSVETEQALPADRLAPPVAASVKNAGIPTEPVSGRLWKMVFCVYLGGAILSLLLSLFGITGILVWIIQAKAVRCGKYRILIQPSGSPAWSLGRYIVIAQDDYDNNRNEIIMHEQAHCRLGHVLDLSLLTVAQTLFWFNPAIHLLKRDLRVVHEFQADDYVLRKGVDAVKYQLLIIRKSVGEKQFALATTFSQPGQIRQRIEMINREKGQRPALWKTLAYVPLLGLMLLAFGSRSEAKPATDNWWEVYARPEALPAVETLRFPQGWIRAGSVPDHYQMGIVPELRDGKNVVTIRSLEDSVAGFGALTQVCMPGKFLGKRVRMTGYMKSENVAVGAGFWLRTDNADKKILTFDNMGSRAVHGTTGWRQYEIVLDVPQDAVNMLFGALINGSGQIWFADLSMEIVDESVPSTDLARYW